jgi:hypothetical protein
LTVGENIFLGREPRRLRVVLWDEFYSRVQRLLNELNLRIDPRTPLRNLGIGQQQLVEIAKALSHDARILVLDEPAAALTDAGNLLELDAIAACVIGGTSLMGGRGTVFGACLGALIMASLDNGMSLMSVEPYVQYIVKGAVLVAAVGFDMLGRRRA